MSCVRRRRLILDCVVRLGNQGFWLYHQFRLPVVLSRFRWRSIFGLGGFLLGVEATAAGSKMQS